MIAAPTHHRLLASLRVRQLELIAVLADAGSMRAAAQRLHLSAAAISKNLRELESLFGVELFHRLNAGVVPTAGGELVAQRARVLLSELGQLADDLAAQALGHADEVRVGAQPFLTWTLLPRILHTMEAAGGLPRARVVEGRMGDICRKLEAGELDVLLTMNLPSELGGLLSGGFLIEPLYEEHWIVVCAPTHAQAPRPNRRGQRSWASLQSERWILPPRPTASRMMLEQALLTRALPPLVPWIESMNAITNLQLAEHCHGLTLAARVTVAAALARGTLVEVPMEDPPAPVAIALVYRAASARRPAVASLRLAAQRACSTATEVLASPSRSAKKFSARRSSP